MTESFAAFLAARGHCLEDNGRGDEAIASYSLAVRKSPQNKQYKKFLASLRNALREYPPSTSLAGGTVFDPIHGPRIIPEGQAFSGYQPWRDNSQNAFPQDNFKSSAVSDFTRGNNHGF